MKPNKKQLTGYEGLPLDGKAKRPIFVRFY
jgi:hypothetical protein